MSGYGSTYLRIPLTNGSFANAYPSDRIGKPQYFTNQAVNRSAYWYEVPEYRMPTPLATLINDPALVAKFNAWRTWSDREAAFDAWHSMEPGSGQRPIGYDSAKQTFNAKCPQPPALSPVEMQRYLAAEKTYRLAQNAKPKPTVVAQSTPATPTPVVQSTIDPTQLASYRKGQETLRAEQAELRYYQSMGFQGSIDDLRKQKADAANKFSFLR